MFNINVASENSIIWIQLVDDIFIFSNFLHNLILNFQVNHDIGFNFINMYLNCLFENSQFEKRFKNFFFILSSIIKRFFYSLKTSLDSLVCGFNKSLLFFGWFLIFFMGNFQIVIEVSKSKFIHDFFLFQSLLFFHFGTHKSRRFILNSIRNRVLDIAYYVGLNDCHKGIGFHKTILFGGYQTNN